MMALTTITAYLMNFQYLFMDGYLIWLWGHECVRFLSRTDNLRHRYKLRPPPTTITPRLIMLKVISIPRREVLYFHTSYITYMKVITTFKYQSINNTGTTISCLLSLKTTTPSLPALFDLVSIFKRGCQRNYNRIVDIGVEPAMDATQKSPPLMVPNADSLTDIRGRNDTQIERNNKRVDAVSSRESSEHPAEPQTMMICSHPCWSILSAKTTDIYPRLPPPQGITSLRDTMVL